MGEKDANLDELREINTACERGLHQYLAGGRKVEFWTVGDFGRLSFLIGDTFSSFELR